MAPQNAGPEARYRACLLRLLSIDEPALKPKVEVLRQNLEAVRRGTRRGNIEFVAMLLFGIGLAVLLGVYLVRALAGFLPAMSAGRRPWDRSVRRRHSAARSLAWTGRDPAERPPFVGRAPLARRLLSNIEMTLAGKGDS